MRNLTADPAGLAVWIDRENQTMHELQVWRELVQNGIEAGATTITIDGWQDPETGHWLTRCTDNGSGMTPEQLIKHLSTLHTRAKGSEGNYGIGARIAALYRNPAGVTFATRTPNGNEQMVRLVRERGAYGIKEWETADGTMDDVVVPTDGELSRLQGPSGTAVILHGNGKSQTWDTSIAYRIHHFLTGRYFDLPEDVTVYVGNPNKKVGGQLERVRPMNLNLDKVAEAKGEVPFVDAAGLSGRILWWVLPTNYDRRLEGRDQTPRGIGLLVDDEVFNNTRTYYGDFGILYSSVQSRVMILVDVNGATMDTARASVVFPLGRGDRRRNTPWKELGRAFADNLPDPIREMAAKVKVSSEAMDEKVANLLDADWMSKLRPMRVSVPDSNGSEHGAGNGNGNGNGSGLGNGNSHHGASQGGKGPTKPRLGAAREGSGNKASSTVERSVVPNVEFLSDKEFDIENHPARITWQENANVVQVAESFAPYVRDVERWVRDSGHSRQVVEQAVRLAYRTELAALIIDANGQDRHGASPAVIDALKADASLYAKCLGMQSLSQRIEEFLKRIAV